MRTHSHPGKPSLPLAVARYLRLVAFFGPALRLLGALPLPLNKAHFGQVVQFDMNRQKNNQTGKSAYPPKVLAATQARNNFSQVINEAAFRGERFLVERHGTILAVIMGIEDYSQLTNSGEPPQHGLWDGS